MKNYFFIKQTKMSIGFCSDFRAAQYLSLGNCEEPYDVYEQENKFVLITEIGNEKTKSSWRDAICVGKLGRYICTARNKLDMINKIFTRAVIYHNYKEVKKYYYGKNAKFITDGPEHLQRLLQHVCQANNFKVFKLYLKIFPQALLFNGYNRSVPIDYNELFIYSIHYLRKDITEFLYRNYPVDVMHMSTHYKMRVESWDMLETLILKDKNIIKVKDKNIIKDEKSERYKFVGQCLNQHTYADLSNIILEYSEDPRKCYLTSAE
jgi:hypothetical protein